VADEEGRRPKTTRQLPSAASKLVCEKKKVSWRESRQKVREKPSAAQVETLHILKTRKLLGPGDLLGIEMEGTDKLARSTSNELGWSEAHPIHVFNLCQKDGWTKNVL